MKKYLITGSTGFVGKNLIEKLHGDIYLYTRGEEVEHVFKVFKPEYIFHLAGEIYDNDKMFDSNVVLTHKLLECSREIDYRAFVYIGSSSEYGRKDHPISEKDHLDPTSIYESTKGAASLLCLGYARTYSKPIMVARPFSLYGKYESEKRFIPTVIRTAKRSGKLALAPGVHDYLHIDDFIDGLLHLVDIPIPGRIVNFGTGIQTSNKEVVRVVEKIMGKKIGYFEIPKMHDYDSDCWVCDPTEMNKFHTPKISLYEGLRRLCHS